MFAVGVGLSTFDQASVSSLIIATSIVYIYHAVIPKHIMWCNSFQPYVAQIQTTCRNM